MRRAYYAGMLEAQDKLRTLAGNGYVTPYLQNEALERELTTVTFPGIARMQEDQRKGD